MASNASLLSRRPDVEHRLDRRAAARLFSSAAMVLSNVGGWEFGAIAAISASVLGEGARRPAESAPAGPVERRHAKRAGHGRRGIVRRRGRGGSRSARLVGVWSARNLGMLGSDARSKGRGAVIPLRRGRGSARWVTIHLSVTKTHRPRPAITRRTGHVEDQSTSGTCVQHCANEGDHLADGDQDHIDYNSNMTNLASHEERGLRDAEGEKRGATNDPLRS